MKKTGYFALLDIEKAYDNDRLVMIQVSDGSVVSFQKTAVAVLASVVVFLKTVVAVLMRLC